MIRTSFMCVSPCVCAGGRRNIRNVKISFTVTHSKLVRLKCSVWHTQHSLCVLCVNTYPVSRV